MPSHPNDIDLLVHVSGPSGGTDDARYRAQVEAYLTFESGMGVHNRKHGEAGTRGGGKQPVNGMDDDHLEVLVHVGAPSSDVDDRKYRAQARTYIGFEAAAVIPKTDMTRAAQNGHQDASVGGDPKITFSTSSDLCDPSLTSQDIRELLDFADDRARELEEQKRLDQGKTQGRQCSPNGTQHSRCSENVPPCSISFGSSFDWTSTPHLPTALSKRRLGPVEAVTDGRHVSKRVLSPLHAHAQDSFSNQSSLSSRHHVPSPVSGVSVAGAAARAKETVHRVDVDQTQHSSANAASHSQLGETGKKKDGVDGLISKRPSGPDLRGHPTLSIHDGPIPSSRSPNKTVRQEDINDGTFSHRHIASLEIHPPPLLTSGETSPTLSSITTPSLELLARKVNLRHRRFRPMHQSRPLQPLERGHWVCDLDRCCNSSRDRDRDRDLRVRFWDFLKEFIEAGRAGWGVWVTLQENADVPEDSEATTIILTSTTSTTNLETDSTTTDDDGRGQLITRSIDPQPIKDSQKSREQAKVTVQRRDERPTERPEPSNAELKVYGFGAMAIHIYALLWVASEGHLKRNHGSRWVDARNEVVIIM